MPRPRVHTSCEHQLADPLAGFRGVSLAQLDERAAPELRCFCDHTQGRLPRSKARTHLYPDIADRFDSLIPHLEARDVTLIAVSGAPITRVRC